MFVLNNENISLVIFALVMCPLLFFVMKYCKAENFMVPSERGREIVEQLGYSMDPKNRVYPCKRNVPKFDSRPFYQDDLTRIGESHSYIVRYFSSESGPNFIWGSRGFRYHIAFLNTKECMTVPFNVHAHREQSRMEGINLRTFLLGLSAKQLSMIEYIVLEEWYETDEPFGEDKNVVNLTFLENVKDQLHLVDSMHQVQSASA